MPKLYEAYRRWAVPGEGRGDGVVVASDMTLEWILPWWWEHYRRHNDYPVTFVDLGMSEEKKQWCRERGEYLLLPVADVFVAEKQDVSPDKIYIWEHCCELGGARFWLSRNAWFKKPSACLQSPYKRSLWLDLDCEVRGPLDALFPLCEQEAGLALFLEGYNPALKLAVYNSGVLVFKHGNPLIEQWAESAFDLNHEFPGDQDALSQIIANQHVPVTLLEKKYNWSRCEGDSEEAVILHWHGLYGKTYIQHQMQTEALLSSSLLKKVSYDHPPQT